ncbi:MAG TPA: thiamine biosynthesis protein ThiS [Lentisphaeria bacterium]|nr:MAG: thiamine biosynthesis protein ThiS [Lentisphaerae bacterium GWF2_49_21]HBC86946.1 thiamine biosynthesis protein ThiS [Lentisphaeria bacterium]
MKIILNGKSKNVEAKNLQALLLELKFDPERALVSLNGNVVEKKKFSKTALSDGDKVDVFSFVGGG